MGNYVSAVSGTQLCAGVTEKVREEMLILLSKTPVPVVEIILDYYKNGGQIEGRFVNQFAAQEYVRKSFFFRQTIETFSYFSPRFENVPWYIAIQEKSIVITESYRFHIFHTHQNKIVTIGSGEKGLNRNQFDGACGIAIKDNRIYICDSHNKRIQIFALENGQYLNEFNVQQGEPFAIRIEDNTIYLTTWYSDYLCAYSLEGNLQNALQLSSTPNGFCVNNGLIFLCEGQPSQQIEIFDAKTLKSLTTLGTGKFNYPEDVIIHHDLLYISDSWDNCIQIWTQDGKFIKKLGKKGAKDGELNIPIGLASNGSNLFIVDHGNYRVQIFE